MSEPSRETLVAKIASLEAVIARQQRMIGSMEASRFWALRNAWFRFLERIGRGYEPLPVPTARDRELAGAASGDRYQLHRLRRQHRSETDVIPRLLPLLAVERPVTVVIDARGAAPGALDRTMASLRKQFYPALRLLTILDGQSLAVDDLDAAWAIAPLGAGDTLEPEALLVLVAELHRGAAIAYSDEDAIAADGTCTAPRFKPDWSPETALTRDYVGGLCLFGSAPLHDAGGLDPRFGAAMWYDALLRIGERVEASIVHVPVVLYHRGSPALDPAEQAPAVRSALARRGEAATVVISPVGCQVRFAVPADERVCVIIPTRDHAALLQRCLASVFERTSHGSFEVIVVDNGSVEPATAEVLRHWRTSEPDRFSVLRDDGPFNYSRLNNRAIARTDAPFVLLLNDDTEVVEPEWMTALLGQARRPSIGAAGALLLYDDGTIQHAGVVFGLLGLAGHAYRARVLDDERLREPLTLDTNYLAVTGACLLVERRKFLEVGGLDEALAVSFNDIDLCAKLRSAGYRNVLVPRARLYHFESRSRGSDDTPEKRARVGLEREAFLSRWAAWIERDPYYNPNLTVGAEDFAIAW